MSPVQYNPGGHERHRGWVHTHSATLVDLFRIIDAGWIVAGLWLASERYGLVWTEAQGWVALLAVALFMLCAALRPLYRSWRFASLQAELMRVTHCWLAALAGVHLLGYFISAYLSAPQLLLLQWGGYTLGGLLMTRSLVRLALRSLRLKGANFRTVAIVGANETTRRVAWHMQNTPWMGLRLVGVYEDRESKQDRVSDGIEVTGTFDDLLREVEAGELDIVYITLPLRAEVRINRMIAQLRDSTVSVYYVPDFSAFGLLRARWDTLGDFPLVTLVDTPHFGVHALSKRIFDIGVASVILAFISAPMLLIAAAIKLSSPGPVIFRQQRNGLDGKQFEIWKFRTMTVCEDGNSQFTQATKGDMRITRLGAFLRRSSLDELPQFVNVLQGRMSIVGPRPHPIALNASHRGQIDGYMLRHKVKPGITGWAQVNGFRGETDTAEKMRGRIHYDLDYINNWSLSLDLRIILMTLRKAVKDSNAY